MLYLNLIILTAIMFVTFIIIYTIWLRLSKIYYDNPTLFEVFFIIIYPIEELLFLFLYYLDDPLKRSLWVAIILLLIFLTVGIDKFLLRKQNEMVINVCVDSQEEIIADKTNTINQLQNKLKQREREKEKLIEYIQILKEE